MHFPRVTQSLLRLVTSRFWIAKLYKNLAGFKPNKKIPKRNKLFAFLTFIHEIN